MTHCAYRACTPRSPAAVVCTHCAATARARLLGPGGRADGDTVLPTRHLYHPAGAGGTTTTCAGYLYWRCRVRTLQHHYHAWKDCADGMPKLPASTTCNTRHYAATRTGKKWDNSYRSTAFCNACTTTCLHLPTAHILPAFTTSCLPALTVFARTLAARNTHIHTTYLPHARAWGSAHFLPTTCPRVSLLPTPAGRRLHAHTTPHALPHGGIDSCELYGLDSHHTLLPATTPF